MWVSGEWIGQSRFWDAQVVGCLERSPIAEAGLHRAEHGGIGVGIKPEDRARVVPGRAVERQPVGLRARKRLLVGIDLPLPERLEPDPRQETLPRVGGPQHRVALVVKVERGRGVLTQHAVAQPLVQEPPRAGVPVHGRIVTRLLTVKLEPDDVIRTRVVEPVLQCRIDHVVWRRHDVRQRADLGHVITNAAEGANVGHHNPFG